MNDIRSKPVDLFGSTIKVSDWVFCSWPGEARKQPHISRVESIEKYPNGTYLITSRHLVDRKQVTFHLDSELVVITKYCGFDNNPTYCLQYQRDSELFKIDPCRDIIGRPLEIGNLVCIQDLRGKTILAEIISFNPTLHTVEVASSRYMLVSAWRYYHECLRIDPSPTLTAYLIKNL